MPDLSRDYALIVEDGIETNVVKITLPAYVINNKESAALYYTDNNWGVVVLKVLTMLEYQTMNTPWLNDDMDSVRKLLSEWNDRQEVPYPNYTAALKALMQVNEMRANTIAELKRRLSSIEKRDNPIGMPE